MKIQNLVIRTLSFYAIIISISCTEDNEITPREYPRLETLEVTNSSELGATFNGKIIHPGNQEIIEYGFVWSSRSDDPTLGDERIILTEKLNNENFSADIKTTLATNWWYHVKAFVKTKEYTVYGINVPFKSLGSKAAIISDFFPKVGTWGDTIQLKGKHFSYVKNNNSVRFKDIRAKEIISSTDSTITCVIPEGLDDKTVSIKLNIAGQVSEAPENLVITVPKITTITPLNATFGDTLTISGENFNKYKVNNTVFFGSVRATIVYSDKNTLKVTVPEDLEKSTESIKLLTQLREIDYPSKFTLIAPKIIFVPKEIHPNEEIIIKVENFNPIIDKNKILFENTEAEIIAQDASSLTVKVPLGPFPRRKARVKIQVLDLITEYELDIDVLGKWVLVSNDIPFVYNKSISNIVVANGEAYIVARPKGSSNTRYYLWKFDSITVSWDIVYTGNGPLTQDLKGSILESDGENIYLYTGNSTNDFWAYDLSLRAWRKKSSFIGITRRDATHFSINGEIYVGLGVDHGSWIIDSYIDFYKYSPSFDKWTKISDVPFGNSDGNSRTRTSTFVINGIGYFTCGAETTEDFDSWSYDPSSDKWTKIADFIDSREYTASFSLNGFGYVTGGVPKTDLRVKECWRYDPGMNIWEKVEDIGIYIRSGHFSFTLNGKSYIGGGIINLESGGNVSFDKIGYDMYEFIP